MPRTPGFYSAVMRLHYTHHKVLFMSMNALVQTRIDPRVKAKASAVLERAGLTVSDAVRILLTRTATEGALPLALIAEPAAHDAWFRAKVQEALTDTRPAVPNEEVKQRFAERRAAAASSRR